MPFQNDREFWIFVETVLHTSQYVKTLPKKQITALAEYIRSEHCPNLSYQTWLDVEKSIVSSKYAVMDSLAKGVTKSMGGDISSKAFDELQKLDKGFRESIEDLDLNEIEKKLKQSKVELPDLTKVLELAKDLQKEKKDFKSRRG